MIEIFEPGGVDYRVERAKEQLVAAEAADLLKARAADLAVADNFRNGRQPNRPRGRNTLPLQIAFAVNDDGSGFDDRPGGLGTITAS
ncbi:MAG: hypothetical protein EOP61_29570 [Sphingomonadales bacterium]|nr:MAG: hypothetical protein EOP61_29570 [Sphingomonadales bacterium]